MTLEELEQKLKSDEELVASTFEEYQNAKASYRKAKITAISNKLLAPYRRFQINFNIAKYELMEELIAKKKAQEVKKSIKLQEKIQKERRKQAEADFKAALREERKEKIVNFVNDRKEEVNEVLLDLKNLGRSTINKTSSFIINVKTAAIEKVKENTTIDLIIQNAITDLKLKQATKEYNKALERKKEEQLRLENQNSAIDFTNGIAIDHMAKKTISSISKQKSFMGKATNRVITYFKAKGEQVTTKINDKISNTKTAITLSTNKVISKVSTTKSKMITVFNNKVDKFKEQVDNKIGDFLVASSDKIAAIKDSANNLKTDVFNKIEEHQERSEKKKDMIAALREQDEKNISIKRAQLNSMIAALEAVNRSSDVFASAPSIETSKTK